MSTILHLDNQNLSTLPTLPEGLEILHCYSNNLSTLPTLPEGLKTLCCDDNNLIDLPLLPEGLDVFMCEGNNLPSWYCNNPVKVREMQIRRIRAAIVIQKEWTKYWYHPNEEGVARYAMYMAGEDLIY